MSIYLIPILAQVDSATPNVSIQILDYLKYGTLGLAGIILLLAFFLYRQAIGLPDAKRMQTAQDGISTYMTVAKWLLIPCMALQILGLVLQAVGPIITPPDPKPKPVSATIRVQPLTKTNQVIFGAAPITVGRGGHVMTVQGLDDEQDIEVNDKDSIVVNLEDLTGRIKKLNQTNLVPASSALTATQPQ